jgi:predicted nucleic acid-binding protein
MTMVVSDTSPLNYLIQIGGVEILPRLFSSILVPPAVVAELRHPDAPVVVKNWAAQLPAWAQVRAPQNAIRFPVLGGGESEALSLAIETRANLILLDDLAARDVAKARGIKTAGTLGLLAQAHLCGWLDFEPTLAKLRGTNYRISEGVVEHVRELVRQQKKG